MTLTEEMRQVADQLEKFSRLYGWHYPARGEWSARQLRREADYLEKSIPGVPSFDNGSNP